jgi:hypothetical protein
MQNVVETIRTPSHEFYIMTHGEVFHTVFLVEYRSINPRNGKPWQASKSTSIAADVVRQGWGMGQPTAYSTRELARAAVEAQRAKLAARR